MCDTPHRDFFGYKTPFYLILWTRKIRDVKLQSHLGQKTCGAVSVRHRVCAAFGVCWRSWRRGCRCRSSSGGWSGCGGLICHAHTFCDRKRSKDKNQQRQIEKPWQLIRLKKQQLSTEPRGLRSFPGMYASSLMLEKVTVAPPTWKGTGLKQR